MQFRNSDTFTGSLTRVIAGEHKVVKPTSFDLWGNPAIPGLQFDRIERCRDKGIWSV